MQESVQSKSVDVERIRSELTGDFAELLFNLLGHPHVKHAFHECLNRKQVRVDVFKIGNRLANAIA